MTNVMDGAYAAGVPYVGSAIVGSTTDRLPIEVATFKFSDEAVNALDAAFRGCIQEMIAAPLNQEALFAIESLANHARRSLSIVKKKSEVEEAEAMVRARVGREAAIIGSAMPLAPAPSAETFGASVIREIMGIAKNLHRDPAKMVQAVAAARAEGMSELADALEAEIMSQYAPGAQPKRTGKVVKLAPPKKRAAR